MTTQPTKIFTVSTYQDGEHAVVAHYTSKADADTHASRLPSWASADVYETQLDHQLPALIQEGAYPLQVEGQLRHLPGLWDVRADDDPPCEGVLRLYTAGMAHCSSPTKDISNSVRFHWAGWALSKEDAKRRAKNAILKLDPNFQKETTP